MIIHGPHENAKYDSDLGPVFLQDWYHTPYLQIVESVMESGGNPKPSSDNNLINGKMDFNCSTKAAGDNSTCTNNAGLSKFKFTTGKTYRLRLINAGSAGLQRFSIDGHNLTVIANDFVPIVSLDGCFKDILYTDFSSIPIPPTLSLSASVSGPTFL